MKLVIIEPLGVNDEKLLSMAKDMLPADLEIVYYNTRVTDTETLIERGRDADIIAVSNLPMNADVINGCKNLKMLSVAFTGVDHIAMDACKANGVLVSNCAGYSTAAVADLVFGMIIALYRNMIPCNDVVRKEGTKDGLVGFELEGKKFGVIGTGAIGLRTAAIANAFGCQVLAYSRTKKDIPGITVILTGGIVTSASSSIEGLLGVDLLQKIHTDIAFVSARGFSVENGLTDFSIYEADLKRMCIKASAKTIALIDHTKFDTSSISSYASIDDLNLVITDSGLSENTKEIYEKAGVDLLIAD